MLLRSFYRLSFSIFYAPKEICVLLWSMNYSRVPNNSNDPNKRNAAKNWGPLLLFGTREYEFSILICQPPNASLRWAGDHFPICTCSETTENKNDVQSLITVIEKDTTIYKHTRRILFRFGVAHLFKRAKDQQQENLKPSRIVWIFQLNVH